MLAKGEAGEGGMLAMALEVLDLRVWKEPYLQRRSGVRPRCFA